MTSLYVWATHADDKFIRSVANPEFTFLNLGATRITDASLEAFGGFSKLTWATLNLTSLSDKGVACLKDAKQLTYLGLNGSKITDRSAEVFATLESLEELLLSETRFSDAGLDQLNKVLPKLRILELKKTPVTKDSIQRFQKNHPNCRIIWDGGTILPVSSTVSSKSAAFEPAVSALSACDPDRFTAEYLLQRGAHCVVFSDRNRYIKTLEELPREPFTIDSIIAISNDQITSAGWQHLSLIRSLRTAKLDGATGLDDRTIDALVGNKDIEYLGISYGKLTSAGLSRLHEFPKLHVLWLMGLKVSDTDLKGLQKVHGLTLLGLQYTPIGDEAVSYLVNSPQIRQLELAGTKVGDEGVARLKVLKELFHLSLDDTKVTDQALMELKSLPKLNTLTLSGTAITDEGLQTLRKFPDLRLVNLARTKVSEAAVRQLKLDLPRLGITWDGKTIEPTSN